MSELEVGDPRLLPLAATSRTLPGAGGGARDENLEKANAVTLVGRLG